MAKTVIAQNIVALNAVTVLRAIHPSASSSKSGLGESFVTPSEPIFTLDSVVFWIHKVGSPVGVVVVRIYAHSGSYGSSSVPTGTHLAESDEIAMQDLPSALSAVTFTFSGVNRITLGVSTYYCVVLINKSGTVDASNCVEEYHHASNSYSGNYMTFYNSNWYPQSTIDSVFIVYGEGTWTQTLYEEIGIGEVMARKVEKTLPETLTFTDKRVIQFTHLLLESLNLADKITQATNLPLLHRVTLYIEKLAKTVILTKTKDTLYLKENIKRG